MIGTIQNIMNDAKHGPYDLTENGHCTGCGSCCSNFLPMTGEEVARIRKYVADKHIRECSHAVNVLSELPGLDATCPFLDSCRKDKKCMIYSVRLLICRIFLCCRKSVGIKAYMKMKVIDVRKEFFGGSL